MGFFYKKNLVQSFRNKSAKPGEVLRSTLNTITASNLHLLALFLVRLSSHLSHWLMVVQRLVYKQQYIWANIYFVRIVYKSLLSHKPGQTCTPKNMVISTEVSVTFLDLLVWVNSNLFFVKNSIESVENNGKKYKYWEVSSSFLNVSTNSKTVRVRSQIKLESGACFRCKVTGCFKKSHIAKR